MQFYLNGYRPGDPLIAEAHPSAAERPREVPKEVDVLIVGCGSAGLVLAAQLANFPEITTAVIDRRDGPLEVGQADGVGLPHGRDVRGVRSGRPPTVRGVLGQRGLVLAARSRGPDQDQACRARPGHRGGLVGVPARDRQSGADADLPPGVHGAVRQSFGAVLRTPASDISLDSRGSSEHPVAVTVQHVRAEATGESAVIRARYVAGCDGSRSAIRTAIGRALVGDLTDESWGVMDVLAVTDFPDIRVKCAINSANHGNILIIPREGGYLVRLYIELDEVSVRSRQTAPHSGEAGRDSQPHHAPVPGRTQRRRVVVGVRDWSAAVREVRRRAGW